MPLAGVPYFLRIGPGALVGWLVGLDGGYGVTWLMVIALGGQVSRPTDGSPLSVICTNRARNVSVRRCKHAVLPKLSDVTTVLQLLQCLVRVLIQ